EGAVVVGELSALGPGEGMSPYFSKMSVFHRRKSTMQPERNSLSALNDVETNIRASDAIQADKKAELLRLLTTLKSEITTLEHTHAAHAESVIGLTERSMHEAIRQPNDPQLTASALQELA